MARIVWTEPALQDLESIADYISLDKPDAAKKLIRRVFEQVQNFGDFLDWVQFQQRYQTCLTGN
jgi:toxin ParE1/3/4